MTGRFWVSLAALMPLLGGCATTGRTSALSFAPPPVNVDTNPDGDTIPHTRTGALAIVDNFIREYRTAAGANADARQGFEVPAFVGTMGAIVATAFGAGTDAVLLGGATNSVFRSGNAYYAPRAKAAIYGNALNGLFCLQQVALGSKPLEIATLQKQRNAPSDDEAATYYLIKNGALGIESIARQRLSDAGSLADATGIAAEYEKSVKAQIAAKEAADKAKAALDASRNNPGKVGFLSLSDASADAEAKFLDLLREEVQQCVLRARA